jgi:hypothetical protein
MDSPLRRTSVAWQAFPYRKELPLFLFRNRWLQTAFAICRIALEISESSSMSEVAVLCIRRTAA